MVASILTASVSERTLLRATTMLAREEGVVRITDVKASVVFGSSLFVRVFTDEGTAANLHFIASLRDAHRPQELTRVDHRLNALFKEPLVFEDGYLTVPQRPGLGLELDEEAFSRACEV